MANLDGMRLHGGRQRSLERIEEPLVASDPRLASMFAIFTTATQYEQMPVTERINGRRRQLLRKAAVFLSTF
jgi:Protein of unknown function (DUF3040)